MLLEADPPGMPSLRSAVQGLPRSGTASRCGAVMSRWLYRGMGVAKRLNSYLGAKWPTVPWSGDQVATLALLLSMAEEEGADTTGL